MAQLEDLYTLIQSLDKSEKRYFKLNSTFQKGEKIYLNLFDSLAGSSQNFISLKEKILKRYSSSAVDISVKHLYKSLMKSLRNYEAEKTVENRLLNSIQDIRILFDKGIFESCFTEIAKTKALALKHEKFSYFLIIARLELQFFTNNEFEELEESSLISRQRQINDTLDYELSIHRHSSLYENLLFRYYENGILRSHDEIEKLNDLLLEEFQIMSNKHYYSFESNALHLHFQSAYFMMTGNETESLKVFYELDKLFSEHRQQWIDSPLYYIYLLNGILQQLWVMGRFNDMAFFITRLHAIDTKSESTLRYINYYVNYFNTCILINKGEFNSALALHKNFLEQSKNQRISITGNADMNLNMAVIYFGLNNYKLALKYVNQILNIHRKYLHRQTYVLSRLLNLIIHFEMADYEFLNYEIRSLERQLKYEKKLYKIEKLTIDFFRKWVNKPLSKSLFEKYEKQLSEISLDQYEKKIFKSFDFIAWVNSKISKGTFADIIKNKSHTV